MTATHIVWLRQDLRLADQPAFAAAAAAGPVIPVYVLDDESPAHRRMGGASRWWLHHSLAALAADLAARGSRLILRRGKADVELAKLAAETGAASVHALRHVEPWWRNTERALGAALPDSCPLHRHDGCYLAPPGSIRTGGDTPFKIYTPFWRALSATMPPTVPTPPAERLGAPASWPASDALDSWALLPTRPDWAGAMRAMWTPGEAGAQDRLAAFAPHAKRYDERRNLPAEPGTSFVSPHLHFGEISPARCWHAVMDCGGSTETYLKELVWRDFGANVVRQYPDYASRNAREAFDRFPWRDPGAPVVAADIAAWREGRTG